jgi:hypothetical protein
MDKQFVNVMNSETVAVPDYVWSEVINYLSTLTAEDPQSVAMIASATDTAVDYVNLILCSAQGQAYVAAKVVRRTTKGVAPRWARGHADLPRVQQDDFLNTITIPQAPGHLDSDLQDRFADAVLEKAKDLKFRRVKASTANRELGIFSREQNRVISQEQNTRRELTMSENLRADQDKRIEALETLAPMLLAHRAAEAA